MRSMKPVAEKAKSREPSLGDSVRMKPMPQAAGVGNERSADVQGAQMSEPGGSALAGAVRHLKSLA